MKKKEKKKKRSDFLTYYITLQSALERSLDGKPIMDKDINQHQAYSSSASMMSGMHASYDTAYRSPLTAYPGVQVSGQPPAVQHIVTTQKPDPVSVTAERAKKIFKQSVREFKKKFFVSS